MKTSNVVKVLALSSICAFSLATGCEGEEWMDEFDPDGSENAFSEDQQDDFDDEEMENDEDSDSTLNHIFRLETDSGNTIDFYEPIPGEILVSETGTVPIPPLLPRVADPSVLTPVEIFEVLKPDAEVPQVLIDAQGRSDNATPLNEMDRDVQIETQEEAFSYDVEATADEAESRGGTNCPYSWFHANFSACTYHGSDWDREVSNATGSFYFTEHNNRTVSFAVCADKWSVIHKIRIRTGIGSFVTKKNVRISQGAYSTWFRTSINRWDTEFSFGSSTGSRFHYCGFGSNN